MPFWFWNDTLKDEVIIKQIADMEAHGVYGFVIHPRIGLPENVKWLGPEMIHAMDVAISEAARRKVYVVLYDEGMYPSGSSGGQVVERNPGHAAHGLAKADIKDGEMFQLKKNQNLVTINTRQDGSQVAIFDQPSGGIIRGLHYTGDDGTGKPGEESPAAGDILNPDAVTSFIELVYDRYAKEFGKYFGTTVIGIFTDEPSPLGRGAAGGIVPGNAGLIRQINKIVGYDIRPYLSDLWYNDNDESLKHREDYYRAVNICLEENYYRRLGNWCSEHGIALMGHPAGSMDIGAERYFQIPGQDLVWRYVEPGEKALRGEHSTMAKCASGAMIHLGLRRNANELYGAYGHNLTFDEMKWLAGWCFVRGQNFLIPHAFYYSIRGPRFDERPPDVGPNAAWWNNYKTYADECRRLSWLNTDSRHVCEIALLTGATRLPWKTPEILFRNQRDFNYIDSRNLTDEAKTDSEGVHIKSMNYKVILIDSLESIGDGLKPSLRTLAANGRLIVWNDPGYKTMFPGAKLVNTSEELISEINELTSPDIMLTPPSGSIRYRHMVKDEVDYYIIFNEEESKVMTEVKTSVKGKAIWIDPYSLERKKYKQNQILNLEPHELRILMIK